MYNEYFQIEYNNFTVDVQRENGSLYSIEIFYPEQSRESFDNAEFSGGFHAHSLINGEYSQYEIGTIFKTLPDFINAEIYNDIIEKVKEQLILDK